MAEEKRILIEKCDGTCCFSLPKKSEDDWPYGTLEYRPLGRYCYFESGFDGPSNKAKLVNEQICANCKHAKYRGLTYDTAIEKMARAMIERYNSERTLTKWEKEWNKKKQKRHINIFILTPKRH